MFKYLILTILFTTILCTDDFTTVSIGANEYLKITLNTDIDNVRIKVISTDGSLFSTYVLNESDYIDDHTTNNFKQHDLLNGECYDMILCDTYTILDYNLNYVIIIENENLLMDGIVSYKFTTDNSTLILGLIVVIFVVASCCAIVGLIGLITYCVKKNMG
jgi:hypothetical protein